MDVKGIAILAGIALLWFILKPLIVGLINGLMGLIGRVGTNKKKLLIPVVKVDNINLQDNTFDILDIETGKKLTYRTIVIRIIIGDILEEKKVVQTKCVTKDGTNMVQFVTEPDDCFTYSEDVKLYYILNDEELSIHPDIDTSWI